MSKFTALRYVLLALLWMPSGIVLGQLPVIQFKTSCAECLKNTTSLISSVVTNNPSQQVASVSYKYYDNPLLGNAISMQDTLLLIPDGSTKSEYVMAVIDDNVVERTQIVTINFANPQDAYHGIAL